ncbi:serine/threonine-protein kinase, partial [Acidisphaera sp. S103]|uniref:serine/threonine-protein kinase n=1 Tax=Acidisphaera sp. S103 TaxID=1747223 RepID=UPI00131B2311
MDKRLGRYELRRPVGRGAAGTVWEAWDTSLTRRVAIKVVRPGDMDVLEIEELLARFRQEAQVAGRLSNVGVVQVYDYGEEDGEAYIVMEFVDGETLKAVLDRPERMTLARAGEIMRGVLQALDNCHRLSVVHRDIKPSNIMLPADGGVKLADFGIVRIENSELTLVGTVMGTPPYMSPEQFTARDPIDFHSDIWSCGVLFYEMLTGSRPFTGKTMAAIGQAVVNDTFEPPSHRVPGLPTAFDQVLQRALRKEPGERFPSAQAFALAIQSAMPPADVA